MRVALAVLTGFLVLYWGIPAAIKYHLQAQFLAKTRRTGRCFLTFDDGPTPGVTEAILEILESHGVRATFFVTGRNVTDFPGVAREICRRGHEIGEHGYAHLHPWKSSPLRQCQDALRMLAVVKQEDALRDAKWYRPPYGKIDLVTLAYAWFRGLQFAFWDVDPKDYAYPAAEIVRRTCKGMELGSIVLLHDGRPPGAVSAWETVRALGAIVEAGVERGKIFSTLSMVNDCAVRR